MLIKRKHFYQNLINLKTPMKIILLFFFLVISSFSFYSCEDNILLSTDTGNYSASNDFFVQLYPGMNLNSGVYFWSTGSSRNFDLYQIDQMGWMNIPQSLFTSNGCSDVKYLNFDLKAPLVERTYTTMIRDRNRHLSDFKWNIVVTKSPTVNITSQTVNINSGDSVTITDVISYSGINTSNFSNSCIPNPYYPSSSMHIRFSFSERLDWVKYSSIDTVVYSGSPITIKKTFRPNVPGTYTFMEILEKQWFSYPIYKKWTIIVS